MLKKLTFLLSPEGEDGGDRGGGGGEDQHDFREEGERGGGEGGGEGDEGGGGKKDDDEGKPTGLTKDDITDILSRVIPTGGGEGEPKQLERQYTQAEIEQMLNVWKPDSSFLKKLGFENPTAEQLAAVHELRDNLIKQANTMSEARIQQLLAEQNKRIEEISGYVSEQRAEATTRSFYSKYEELKPYEEIVEAVSAKLESTGFKAPTQTKVFEEIAKQTQEVLKRMNIKVEKPKAGGAGNGGAAGKSRMAQLAGGGQGGGEKGGGGREGRKKDMAIFDEVEE